MGSNTPSLHRFALLSAALALAAMIAGAVITSTEVVARQAQVAAGPINTLPHRLLGYAVLALGLTLAVWIQAGKSRGIVRALAWSGVATLAAEIWLGWPPPPLSPVLGTLHAFLAHLYFAIAVLIAIFTSPAWGREHPKVDDGGRSFLRPLALWTPPVVLLQVGMGSAYRHQAMGIMPHMGGAMIVALMTLIVSAVVLQNFPEPRSLNRAAVILISLVLAQVCLGITAFLMLVLNVAGSMIFFAVTVGHVTIGALTLGASILMAVEVARSLIRKKEAV